MVGSKRGRGQPGDVVGNLVEPVAERQLRGDFRDRKPGRLRASADERDTRGFISITTIRPSAGSTANWMFDPPVWVVPAGHKFSASLCDGPFEGLDFPGAVQPGIITEPAAGEVLCDPVGRRLVDQMMEREVFLPHLDRDLERVAAVDEDRGLLHQYDCRARRAAETCQPGEPLAPPGQHFTLVFIGVRYDETVEPEPLEFAAHSLQAPGRSRRRGIEAVFRPGCNRRLQRPELIPQFVTRLCCHQAQPQITVHILRRGKHTGDNSAYIGNRLSRSLCRQQFGKTKIVPIAGWIIGEGSGHGSVRTFRRG